jgi:peroxiredoxin Q/BCP
MAIEEGKKAPPLALDNADGVHVSLQDFAGRHVVVYFYPRDDTPGCTKEACGFRDAWGELGALGVVVLGVSPDSRDAHRRFIAKYNLPFQLLCDPQHTVMERYGAWGEKVLYGKKKVGVIRSTVWVNPSGKVQKHWRRVANAADHPQHVLKAIAEFRP